MQHHVLCLFHVSIVIESATVTELHFSATEGMWGRIRKLKNTVKLWLIGVIANDNICMSTSNISSGAVQSIPHALCCHNSYSLQVLQDYFSNCVACKYSLTQLKVAGLQVQLKQLQVSKNLLEKELETQREQYERSVKVVPNDANLVWLVREIMP